MSFTLPPGKPRRFSPLPTWPALAVAGLLVTGGLAACSSGPGSPQAWCWSWTVASDGSGAVASSAGSSSCSGNDDGRLVSAEPGTYTWSYLGTSIGYSASNSSVPVNDGLACTAGGPGQAGGDRVYVGTHGFDAAGDACKTFQKGAGTVVMTGLLLKLERQQLQQANVDQAQQDLQQDLSQLEDDTGSLSSGTTGQLASDVSSMKRLLQQAESDYQAEEQDAQSSCATDGPLAGPASDVDSDTDGADAAFTQLQNDATHSAGYSVDSTTSSTVKEDISRVSSDVAGLKSLGQSPPAKVAQDIAAANEAINGAGSEVNTALSQGQTIDNQVHQIDTDADALLAKSNC